MLEQSQRTEIKSLVIDKRPLEVVMSEDGVSPLTFVMPPFEDIAEIGALQERNFSIRELSVAAHATVFSSLEIERSRLAGKRAKFGASPTYMNRLANLASLVGDLGGEEAYLREALERFDDGFFATRLAESLIGRHASTEAEQLLSRKDLSRSVHANLRLAAISAVRSDVEGATVWVAQAVRIDPLDFGARMFEGALRLWRGEYQAAILSFRIASEQRPNSAALYTNMAVAYVRMQRLDKALQKLKLATAIDPLNTNSVSFLADVCYALNRDEDAIPSLRYYLRFEQKHSDVWGRLARALTKIRETGEAIAALKRQASLGEFAGVWNNLGVAYHIRGEDQSALESFKRAITLSPSTSNFDFCLAARNAAASLSRSGRAEDVIVFVNSVVRPENVELFATRRELCGIFITKLYALVKSKKIELAEQFGEEILRFGRATLSLRLRAVTDLLALYSINEGGRTRALQLAAEFSDIALHGDLEDERVRVRLLNNIAFVFADVGDLPKARLHLQAISSEIHKSPYPTATLGLLHLREGHHERADSLYDEALGLCISRNDKARIRQKWSLEKGRSLISTDPRRAMRFLSKARDEKEAEDGLSSIAGALIRSLGAAL